MKNWKAESIDLKPADEEYQNEEITVLSVLYPDGTIKMVQEFSVDFAVLKTENLILLERKNYVIKKLKR